MEQNNKFFIIICIVLCAFSAMAQQTTKTFKGRVLSAGKPVASASIYFENKVIQADGSGYFDFTTTKPSLHFRITATGMEPFSRQVDLGATTSSPIIFELQSDDKEIQQVEVFGRTKVQEVNRQAFSVTALDATKLYNTTMDISSALDRVAGVRVRESGGVGSNFNLMLNGFNGDQIRYFIDGIPMENFGAAFQINNIPINIAERVEIYKGVVPVWLGSDALGGAVNIVTGDRMHSYVDASYSFGSFNTHRTVINAAHTTKNGLYFQLNAFQNYSDNNYNVTVDVADINTGVYQEGIKLKRFHDTYHNESLIANIGVINKPYADKLLLGVVLGKSYKEIQTGARMVSVFGAWHNRATTVMPTLKYKKTNLFVEGLDLILNGNINLGYNHNIDTVHARFDWYGNKKQLDGPGGERSYSMYKYRNNAGIANAILNYSLSERQSVSLTDVFDTFKRSGSDEVNPQDAVNEKSKLSQKNVLALGYQYDIRDLLSLNIFLKHYSQHNVSGDNELEKNISKFGYGAAASYYLNPELQIKGSYELTTKMPTPTELFGDVENYEGNYDLKPERSNNINLGLLYDFHIDRDNRFALMANGFLRHADDFIYRRLNNNQSKYISDNRDGVQSFGGDLDLRYSHQNWFATGVNMTYQKVKNMQKVEPGYTGISPLYKLDMPNIPNLFGNVDASVILQDFGGKNNQLTISANMLFVREFWLYWPVLGSKDEADDKKKIPTQISFDANVVYSLANGRYNIAVEGKNLSDNRLVDNFSLQKPSRGLYLNLRYFFNKQ